jgi:hypothetical protein
VPALLAVGFESLEAPVATVGEAAEVLTDEGLLGTPVRLPAGSCERLEMDEGREVAFPVGSGYHSQMQQKEMVVNHWVNERCYKNKK